MLLRLSLWFTVMDDVACVKGVEDGFQEARESVFLSLITFADRHVAIKSLAPGIVEKFLC